MIFDHEILKSLHLLLMLLDAHPIPFIIITQIIRSTENLSGNGILPKITINEAKHGARC